MTIEVFEQDGNCYAQVPSGDDWLPCCEPGHPDAAEAAGHALRLTQAIGRKTAETA